MISIQRDLRFGDHIGPVCENRRSTALETNHMKEWNTFFKRVHAFFTNECQSTWEKMTGTLWQEWIK